MGDLVQELYSALKREGADYHARMQGLWLQKLTLSGAVIAFLLVNDERLDLLVGSWATLGAVALIPLLAILMDLKFLEYALHVRAISRFIARRFQDERLVGEWESTLWGDLTSGERTLVRIRSAITIAAAAVPTVALLGLSTLLFIRAGFGALAIAAGIGAAVAYLVIGIVAVRTVMTAR